MTHHLHRWVGEAGEAGLGGQQKGMARPKKDGLVGLRLLSYVHCGGNRKGLDTPNRARR